MAAHEQGSEVIDFVVARGNLRHTQCVRTAAAPELAPDQILLRVDQFAFTANNVTYAVAGDMMSYWNFFPADSGWGRVPVWGFADVLRSRHRGVSEGARVYGYLPMSTHLVVRPDSVARGGFVDAAPHRAELPPIYNQYLLTDRDPNYTAGHEAQQMLFRPLFTTSFLLEDFLADNGDFGARATLLSSASSKTAFGLAFLLSRARRGEVIGLTSVANAAFVERLGCYDRVVTYDRIASLPAQPAAFVDMAGDGRVVSAVHQHFRDELKHSCIVGVTHWEQREPMQELPGPTPSFFFAPTQLQKRLQEWGADEYQRRYAVAWRAFVDFVAPHVRVVRGSGPEAVERVYMDMLEGRARPDEGHILSLWS
jgi:hypothetical protein